MKHRLLAVLVLCLPIASQERFRRPEFPPDVIAHDSPIRDLARIDTRHVRVDSDNSRMRVLRISLPAGEALPMHDARDSVLVCLTACSLALTNPVGYVVEVKLGAGRTRWIGAARHRIVNTGAAADFLFIEAKRPM